MFRVHDDAKPSSEKAALAHGAIPVAPRLYIKYYHASEISLWRQIGADGFLTKEETRGRRSRTGRPVRRHPCRRTHYYTLIW